MHFSFEKEGHVYTMDGARIPSVTEVLGENRMLPDYRALDPYYAIRGTAVHEAVALELQGRLDWDSLDEHTRPYVERAARLIEMLQIEAMAVETQWASRAYRYAGTVDLFCRSNLGPLLLDWKAGGPEVAHKIQVGGGYRPLMIEAAEEGAVPMEPTEVRHARAGVVCLNTEIPKPLWVDNLEQAELIFRSALVLTNFRRTHKIRRHIA